MNKLRRTKRWLIWIFGSTVGLLLIMYFVFFYVANTSWLQQRVVAYVASTYQIQVAFKQVSPALAPLPHIVISQGRLSDPKRFTIRFDQFVLYPELWSLLSFKLKIRKLIFFQPDVVLYSIQKETFGAPRNPFDTIRIFNNKLNSITGFIPQTVQIKDGHFKLMMVENRKIVEMHHVSANASISNGERLDFQSGAPIVIIHNETSSVRLQGVRMNGNSQWSRQNVHLHITHFKAIEPQIEMKGQATWDFTDRFIPIPTDLAVDGRALKVAEIRGALLSFFDKSVIIQKIFEIVQGGILASWTVNLFPYTPERKSLRERLQCKLWLRDGKIVLPGKHIAIAGINGEAQWTHGRFIAQHLTGRFPENQIIAQNGTLVLGLLDGSQRFHLNTDIETDLGRLPAILEKLLPNKTDLSSLNKLPEIRGHAAGNLEMGEHFDQLQVRIRMDSASNFDMLDSTVKIAGTIDTLPSVGMAINLSVRGHLGVKTMDWIGKYHPGFKTYLPQAPVIIRHAHIISGSAGDMALYGDFTLNDNIALSIALKIDKNSFQLEKLDLKDRFSDVRFFAKCGRKGTLWQADFRGMLNGATLASMFQTPFLRIGQIQGDLKLQIDTTRLQQSSIQGGLMFDHVEIPMHQSQPLCIQKAIFHGEAQHIVIESADISWYEDSLHVNGQGTIERPETIRLNLNVCAQDLDIDHILQRIEAEKLVANRQGSRKLPVLNVSSKINLAVDRLAVGGYRFSPVQAEISIGPSQMRVKVMTAGLCGISVPGRIDFFDHTIKLAFEPHAKQTIFSDVGKCFYGLHVTERLEGRITLVGNIASSGKNRDELVHNLSGHLDLSVNDGRIYNVGTVGTVTNLLAYLSINQLVQEGGPDLRSADFPFNSMTAKLSLKKGQVHLEEGVLKSNSVNIVANGDLWLANQTLNLVLLVSPLTTVDWIIDHLPIVGHILEGTLIALPMGIKGPVVNPSVLPLSPTAIGSRLGGILKRTLKTPFRIIEPLIKDEKTGS